jgi:acyl carrier protein
LARRAPSVRLHGRDHEVGKPYMENSVTDVRATVFDTLRGSLGKPVELSDDTNIANDLGLDSVAVMDFVMEVEDRLDITVPLDRIAEVETLGDLVTAIRGLKGTA